MQINTISNWFYWNVRVQRLLSFTGLHAYGDVSFMVHVSYHHKGLSSNLFHTV